MDAFDHAHVVQRNVQVVVHRLAKLAAFVAGQAKRDQSVAVGPIDGGSAHSGCCPNR